MDPLSADLAVQAFVYDKHRFVMDYWTNMDDRPRAARHDQHAGRGGDFVAGIDNEALDFSQLEAFINSDGGAPSNGNYFTDTGPSTPSIDGGHGGRLLNVIVVNKRKSGHSLPDSPPDSSSEHPYSPTSTDALYTQLSAPDPSTCSAIYKPGLLNTAILGDGLMLVSDSNGGETADGHLLPPHNQLLIPSEYDKNLMHMGYSAGGGGGGSSGDTGLDLPGASSVPSSSSSSTATTNHEQHLDDIVYTNLQVVPPAAPPTSKKRKHSQDGSAVKSEPDHCSAGQLSPPTNNNANNTASIDDEYAGSESCLSDSQFQSIRFQAFQPVAWHALCDQNLSELPSPHYRVDADKGFNFSNADDAFVCQKKNHFQITCHVQLLGDAQFVKTAEGFQKIASFHLHFYGVKHDCPTQTIRVEQSQSDRSKKPFHPVLVELLSAQVTKVTVGRLHFSETTSNNMRKKGKPNPEQRYFQLVVGLHAHTSHGAHYAIASQASQRIIVRASNPGQFESDAELCWQRGQTADSICHAGRVGVNTDRPDESLVVHGNLKISGHIVQPSDLRAKRNITECDGAVQLRNVQRLRVVRYEYEPECAAQLRRAAGFVDTGVIAQEVAAVLPEAVRPAGQLLLADGRAIDDFLVVNKERIFMENVGAVKELAKVTDHLETRIDHLERISRHLCTSKRRSKKSGGGEQRQPLCSNAFIQLTIIALVLIMAACLAALTTLYFLETTRHNQMTQASLQAVQRTLTTLRPPTATFTPPTKSKTHGGSGMWRRPTQRMNPSTAPPSTPPIRPPIPHDARVHVLGRPLECADDFDGSPTLMCPVYCCTSSSTSSSILAPSIDDDDDLPLPSGNFDHEVIAQAAPLATNRTDNNLLELEKAHVVLKALHGNNLERASAGTRRRRDDEWAERGSASGGVVGGSGSNNNGYDLGYDELHFSVSLHGRHFNASLDGGAYVAAVSTPYNHTYVLPLSKYMPDDRITLAFQSAHAHHKDIEHCYSAQMQGACVGVGVPMGVARQRVNERVPTQLMNAQSVLFDVDLVGVQYKVMTYRASLKQNQNKCKLTPTKLGIEFTEYNFHVYRHCDESA